MSILTYEELGLSFLSLLMKKGKNGIGLYVETATKPDYCGVLKKMSGAIRVQEMYPPGHPATLQAMEKPFSALQDILKLTDHLTISQVGDRIIMNGITIEGESLPERLLQKFKSENINSLTFTKDLTKEELEIFLSFFVKPLNQEVHPESLPEFLQNNEVRSIKVDQLRYELVSEGEVVVKEEVLEGADLKAQISAIMKDNPDLVRDILLNKSVEEKAILDRFGSQINLHQLTAEIGKQLKELSDNEILILVASSLEEKLKTSDSPDQPTALNEMVDLVHKLLEDREKRKLLPEVKKMLSERGIIEKEHLDFLFDQKWLKSQAVLDELVGMIEKLGTEAVDFGRFMFLWHRVFISEDTEIKSYAMAQILRKLDSENCQTSNLAISALKEALSHFAKVKSEFEWAYIKDHLCKKIKDPPMPAYILKNCTELVKVIFFEMIKRDQFKEAHQILMEYHARLSSEMSCPQEVKDVVSNFIYEVSDEPTLTTLIGHIKEGAPSQTIKLVEEILESLNGDKVAEKLLDIFTVDDRATRMSALRVLSRLGKSSVSALSSLLSNPGTFIREKGTELLANEPWYKVRNAIYVLGNIASEESILSLSKLNQDSDPRVRLEVIKALERIGGSESVGDGERNRAMNLLLTFLSDKEDEIRRNVITSLTRLGDGRCLPWLIDHFQHNRRDKQITLTAIGKIGGDELTGGGEPSRTIQFLVDLLWEEEVGIKHLPPKEKEEIKITALNILGKIGSSIIVEQIEEFVRNKKKGLKGLLTKDRVIECANRTLKSIQNRYNQPRCDKINAQKKPSQMVNS